MNALSGNIVIRSIADISLLLAVFFLPWWAGLSLAVSLFFAFERFIELFLAAFLMDLLYSAELSRFGGFEFVLSLGAVLLYGALSLLKRRIRF